MIACAGATQQCGVSSSCHLAVARRPFGCPDPIQGRSAQPKKSENGSGVTPRARQTSENGSGAAPQPPKK
jgi:hypothetical protein